MLLLVLPELILVPVPVNVFKIDFFLNSGLEMHQSLPLIVLSCLYLALNVFEFASVAHLRILHIRRPHHRLTQVPLKLRTLNLLLPFLIRQRLFFHWLALFNYGDLILLLLWLHFFFIFINNIEIDRSIIFIVVTL